MKRAFTSLAKSILAGTAVAAFVVIVILAVMFAPFVGSVHDLAQVAGWLGYAAAICFGIVLLGVLLFGLPTTFVLRTFRRESERAYVIAGTTFGFLMPFVFLLLSSAIDGYWLTILGALAGGAAARVWWRKYQLLVVQL